MQNLSRRQSIALAAGGAVAGAVGIAGAASADAPPQSRGKGLSGTWALGVRFPDGTVNPTVISFDSSGSLVETNALTRSTGLGSWVHDSGERFSYVFWEQFFDAQNVLQSHIRVEHHLNIDASGGAYAGEGKGDVYDLSWNVVATIPTTFTAKRLA